MKMDYDHRQIEKRWQERWLAEKIHRAREDSPKPKYYQLETFPYPSAAGLHVGHPRGYIAEDICARFQRMRGFETLYTMGWDAFGLPTENYAVKVEKSPREVAQENITNFRRQIQTLGLSYDWEREINTSDPSYYRWTQWLFLQLLKKGLAYRAKAKVNWCPKDQTVLAHEQVIDGRCERDGEPVVQREMEQWFFKITAYADRLLKDLEGLDWPAASRKRQEDWIGRSEGTVIKFGAIEVFTTRPDTLAGATYLVLAPEHSFIAGHASSIINHNEVRDYVDQAKNKTDLERQESRKTGVELKGITARNPLTNQEIPVWVADYVLAGYGTGAIMAVPAHDQRDWKFAQKFALPITRVICPNHSHPVCPILENAYEGEGVLVGSGQFNDMKSPEARPAITAWLKKSNAGTETVVYRIRDWSVSRQRYWGTPIPVIHCSRCGLVPVLEKDLPVLLPQDVDYRPKGMPPLASSPTFINVICPQCGGAAQRDPETLDTFVDSSWYFLRYVDPQNADVPFDKLKASHWLPVDLYIIGAEHTTLHLLYARFITKCLYDLGWIVFQEPFRRLRHVGLILGRDGQKMSKSQGNVVNPDELVEGFGADALRLYEMFLGPFEDSHPWDPQGIVGTHRFLNRVWRLFSSAKNESKTNKRIDRFEIDSLFVNRILHQTIKKVTEDIENFRFNTAVSALMILVNELEKIPQLGIESWELKVAETTILLLFPFTPHLAQELWERLGHETFLDGETWPAWEETMTRTETFNLIIQVNGKVRHRLALTRDADQRTAETAALEAEKVKQWIGDKPIRKVFFVPDRLINFIV